MGEKGARKGHPVFQMRKTVMVGNIHMMHLYNGYRWWGMRKTMMGGYSNGLEFPEKHIMSGEVTTAI